MTKSSIRLFLLCTLEDTAHYASFLLAPAEPLAKDFFALLQCYSLSQCNNVTVFLSVTVLVSVTVLLSVTVL